jgi:hypothetical protein
VSIHPPYVRPYWTQTRFYVVAFYVIAFYVIAKEGTAILDLVLVRQGLMRAEQEADAGALAQL